VTVASALHRRGALEPLRHPQFLSCWLGGTLAHSANWMQSIAVPYLVFEMTGSNTWLGVAALASQAPSLVGAPIGGVLADRYSRRLILILTNAAKAVAALGLLLLWRMKALTPPRIIVLLTVTGFAASVNITCWQSFVAQIVPKSSLAAAFRLNAMQFNLSRAVGPLVAGWVVHALGPGPAFLINALAYVPFTAAVALAHPRRTAPMPRLGALREFREGLAVALRHRGLWIPILTAGLVSMLGQGLHQLMAGLAVDVFQVGAKGFGGMMSSVGAASVIALAVIVFLGDRISRSLLAQVGLFTYAAGMLLVASTSTYAVGLAGFAVTGLAHVMVHVQTTTSLQVKVSDEFRGRVTSLYLTGIIALIPVGALVGGWLGDRVGLPSVVALYGVAVAAYALFSWLRLDRLRPLDGDKPLS
jgi:MFS family permease